MSMTLKDLIESYQTDKVSSFQRLRYHVRENHKTLLRRLIASHGHVELSAIKHRDLTAWHLEWSEGGKLSSGHAFIAQIRTVCGYGGAMLENEQCERISLVLHRMRFPQPAPRSVWLTADQANAVRAVAHANFGWHSLAFAQALQFELLLRQKDVIGEWVPEDEPGDSDLHYRGEKWLRGLRWSEIDDAMVIKHKTSKRQKVLEIDLKLAPMVMEELALIAKVPVAKLTRDMLPVAGPVVLNELTALPWTGAEFRRKWRLVANEAGVPKTVRNMDSRAGGITEATEAGADIEHVKHAATHSDIAQTQRYSRGAADKIAGVQKMRSQHRDKFRHNS